MSQVTIKDVAKHAGVSPTTVSWVVRNGTGGNVRISDETRDRVKASIRELGYRPNAVARNLRMQRTQLVAVMVPDLTNPFFPQLIRGAQGIVEDRGYQLAVYDTHGRRDREQAFVESMLERRVDGVILMPLYVGTQEAAQLVSAGLAVATTASQIDIEGVDVVAEDVEATARRAMEHLLERSHRRIAHLAGTQDTLPGRVRLEAYRAALEDGGVETDDRMIRFGTFEAEGVDPLVRSLFAEPTPPTAIFAANDQMAIAAIKTCRHAGVRVPGDVAVVGIDNIPEATAVDPELTTLDLAPLEFGVSLARVLLQRIEGKSTSPSQRLTITGELVVREST